MSKSTALGPNFIPTLNIAQTCQHQPYVKSPSDNCQINLQTSAESQVSNPNLHHKIINPSLHSERKDEDPIFDSQDLSADNYKSIVQQDKKSKGTKKLTINPILANQPINNASYNAILTSRSSCQDSIKLSHLFYNDIKKEEQMLKTIEEKALMLKMKEKRERNLLKQFRRKESQLTSNIAPCDEKLVRSRAQHSKSKSGDIGEVWAIKKEALESTKDRQNIHVLQQQIRDLNSQLTKEMQQCKRQMELVQSLQEESEQLRKENSNLSNQLALNKKKQQELNRLLVQNQELKMIIKELHQQQLKQQQLKPIRQDQLTQMTAKMASLASEYQEKDKQLKLLEQCLANAESHIKKVEAKYFVSKNELTEKNLQYDLLWMQLQDEISKAKSLEQKASAKIRKEMQSLHSEKYQISSSKSIISHRQSLKRGLSSDSLLQIQLGGIMQQGNNELILALPLSHSIPQGQGLLQRELELSILSPGLDKAKQQQLQEITAKKPSILLNSHNELSQALSESEKYDQIIELASNRNSNASKMESSLGSFSEYSRVKSSQSAVTFHQTEEHYRERMRNTKLLAKLNKFKNKK